MNDFLIPVIAKGTVNFLEGLAAAGVATAVNALPGVPPVGSRRFYIRAVEVLAMEHIGMTFLFFASTAAPTANVDTDRFISSVGFTAGQGIQYNNTGLWRYYVDSMAVPYYMDGSGNSVTPPTLNVALQLQGATAKTAGAPGAVSATFWLQQMQTP